MPFIFMAGRFRFLLILPIRMTNGQRVQLPFELLPMGKKFVHVRKKNGVMMKFKKNE